MDAKRLEKNFKLLYESPNNVPAPYHLEAVFAFSDFFSENPNVSVAIQYVDRDDFSKEELMAEGLSLEDTFHWNGPLPLVWRDRLRDSFLRYKSGSSDPRDEEPFVILESSDTSTSKPNMLDAEETLIQEFMQALFEYEGKEMTLFLGFQFADEEGEWQRIDGELSFYNLNFNYITGPDTPVRMVNDWDALQALMSLLFIGEFHFDKGKEELKQMRNFAVMPGDGKWYVAGDSWRKPSGNHFYFDQIEDSLRTLFTL